MGHHQHPFKLFLLTGALGATPALPQANCPVPRVIAPALHQTVSDARPVIRWAALPGAARYRLVLTARKPEGGVLSSIDTWVTGLAFIPPTALAVTTAEVTLALSTDCGTNMVAPTPTPIAHRFYIDMRPRCRLPEAPTAETSPGRRRINWQKAANADRYEVLGYAAFDGRLLFSDETRDLWFAVPDHASGLLVIVVRPRCGPIDGAPAYLLN